MTVIWLLRGGDKMAAYKDLGLSPLVKHQNYNQLLKNHWEKKTETHQKRYSTLKDEKEDTARW